MVMNGSYGIFKGADPTPTWTVKMHGNPQLWQLAFWLRFTSGTSQIWHMSAKHYTVLFSSRTIVGAIMQIKIQPLCKIW